MTLTTTAASPAAHLTPALSAAMREGSRPEHEAAESSTFISDLLGGRVSAAGYAAYLRRLRTVYAALETAMRREASDPLVAGVHDPALERLTTLDADLGHWAPGTPHETDSAAAEAYSQRIREASWGGLLVAHHYTRYLGDLSGGQAIGRILDREFGLDGAGLAFYAFPAVGRTKPYKDAYRARLDALGLDATDTARVVDEVKVAFALNQAVFAELAAELARRPEWRR